MSELTEVIKTSPIQIDQSMRIDEWRGITSCKAGKIVPLAYVPLLREDGIQSGAYSVTVDMAETVKTLLNGVNVTVMAHFVPFLAFDRFERSLDRFNRSYQGQPDKTGGTVVPFFDTITYNATHEIWKTLGVHAATGATLNASVIEAYNALVNFRYAARSKNLTLRTALDTTLAPCFWRASPFSDVVPDFDQAMIDGEVALQFVPQSLPVMGIGINPANAVLAGPANINQTDGTTQSWTDYYNSSAIKINNTTDKIPQIFAELAGNGVTLSLSNIELAKKTAAFAALRTQYSGLDDDAIIDLLMEGIRVPDQALSQPILVAKQTAMIGYQERFATDAANLDTSVTTGIAQANLRIRLPRMNTGGILLVTAEIVPEQMFERMRDVFVHTTDPAELPNAQNDFLDPEKVDVVLNKDVDVAHTVPDGVFGYAGLNRAWNRSAPHIGGRFMRGSGSAEDRQRLWAVEQTNPALTTDFYLATNLHQNVFADTLAENFEIVTVGGCQIVGNTVFGKRLQEDTGDYALVLGQVDQGRITQ